jgi:hypothetical protein
MVTTIPGEKRWQGMKEQAETLLRSMRDEMQGYFDDRSEAWQESEKAEAFQERIDAIDGLLDQIDGVGPG